jgi:hypothetical protein
MDNLMNNAFSIVRHKMYSKVPNTPLKMKEDVMMLQVREEFGCRFDKLSGSDDVNEEPNGCGIMLSKLFINIFGILDIKTSGFDKCLIFYFFYDSEVVRGGGRCWGG